MNVGYASSSDDDQDGSVQVDLLVAAGCPKEQIYLAVLAKERKPQLEAAFKALKRGDTLIVCSLEHLATSAKQFLSMAAELDRRGVRLQSLHEGIDTGGHEHGFFHVCASLRRIEIAAARSRAKAGLQAARDQGKTGGARERLTEEEQERLVCMYGDGTHVTVNSIAEKFTITRATVYRYLRKHGALHAL